MLQRRGSSLTIIQLCPVLKLKELAVNRWVLLWLGCACWLAASDHPIRTQRVHADEATATVPSNPTPLAAGLEPAEAARRMAVPDGFRVQLAASEPHVHQPVALAVDERGRIWVAEAHTYPQRAPEGEGRDKILILEDTNGDGTLDSRKLFADGLNLVSGLEVGFGGVWVGAAPYLLFIPDRDGDDRPDAEPQVLLDGFGYQDTHETLNAFIWGPDGWLYGCHGVFTHSNVGKPGTPKEQREPLNAGVWRYHPLRHQFEVFAWGSSNPWGVDFDDHGQAFITACVIPHLYHVIQGARYQRQGGQHFGAHVYDDLKTIADHAHYVGNIADHAWWGHEPDVPPDTASAGGGHAHCGAMIYLGDNWPDSYRNQLFFHNVHGNRVNCDVLERRGSGYVGRHGKDLLLANDKWFRGINLKYGPDGSVYLIDWYDRNACHRVNPEIWDRTNGRIYRISYGEPRQARVDLGRASDAQLVALHTHKNDWYVRMARRVLQQRGPKADVHTALQKLLAQSTDVTHQLRALWTLHATGGLDEKLATRLLGHPEESVRAWTVQLALEDREGGPEFLTRLLELARQDASARVRLYLASGLQRLPVSQRWAIAEALLARGEDAEDHNLPLMNWYAVEPLALEDPARALELAFSSRIPVVTEFLIRRLASDDKTLNAVARALSDTGDPVRQAMILQQMLAAFEGRVNIPLPTSWAKAYDQLAKSPNSELREQADRVAVALGDQRVFPRMRQLLLDAAGSIAARQRALEILVRGRDKDAADVFQQVLDEPMLRGSAIRALAAHDHPQTAIRILAVYSQLDDTEKRDAVSTLVSRPAYAVALLDAIEKQQVPRTDLHAYNVRQLLALQDNTLRERIEEVWGEIREAAADKQQQIANLRSELDAKVLKEADPGNGRRVFNKICGSCHVLFGEGGKVGPDITGSNRANLDYLLENILDPSAVLGRDFRMTILTTEDGRVVSGLILKETDSALTVRTINDTVVVAKADIEERQLSPLSLMPERLLEPLQSQEVHDLFAYLVSPTPVPQRGPRAPLDRQTKAVPGALEGETLGVAEKTRGAATPQSMGGFPADRWSGGQQLWWTDSQPGDKLELEVLVDKDGVYVVELVLTQAPDYGVVQLWLAGEKLGEPLDCYAPQVVTTGVLTFEKRKLRAGKEKLVVEMLGANPKANPAHMFGLDYLRLRSAE